MNPTVLRSSLVLAALGAALAASAQNLVKNGDFESTPAGATYAPGASFDGNWTLGSVYPAGPGTTGYPFDQDLGARGTTGSPTVISGAKSFFLSPATLSQTLDTTPGTTYRIDFDAFSIFAVNTLTVSFGAATSPVPVVSGDPFGPTNAPNQYTKHFSYLVSATESSTTLTFANSPLILNGDDPNTAVLDNVSVQAVPEPATMAALGLGALAVLRRRKHA